MFNKKIVVIIILTVVIFFSSAMMVFFLAKRSGDRITSTLSAMDELKSDHPEFSDTQLKFYAETAAKKDIAPCLSRDDKNTCIASIAFIIKDDDFCHSLEDETLLMKCVNDISKKSAKAEISQCWSLLGDDYYNCLAGIFTVDNEPQDCASFLEAETRVVCEDLANYQTAYLNYNRALCEKVKTDKLNQYCLKNIIDKNKDTDGDGLTDLDEAKTYKTHYLFVDSDSDGLTDGDEVKKYQTDPLSVDTRGLGMTDGEAVKRGLIKAK